MIPHPLLRAGSKARVTVCEVPGRSFAGTVALRAGALDPSSRTQLVEVILPNRDGTLVPGMYADVRLIPAHAPTSLCIPGIALDINAQGTQVVKQMPDGRGYHQPVQVGFDFGTELEIVSGLRGGEKLVNNPADTLQEGTRVQVAGPASAARGAGRGSARK